MARATAVASPASRPLSLLCVAPPIALYIHIPFCVSLCPYCDFVVYAGAAARGPRARVEAFVAALRAETGASGGCARCGLSGRPPAARDGLPRRRDTVAPAGRDDRRAPRPGPRPLRPGSRRRGHARGQPGARRARRRRCAQGGRRHPAVARRPGDVRRGPAPPWASPPGGGRRARRGRCPRRRDRLDQPRPPVRRPGCVPRRLDRDARGRLGARARPPVALRAHARRSRRGGFDRPRRRPSADDGRCATLAGEGAAGPGRGSRRGPVPPCGPPTGGRRLARLRDQQLGTARTRKPPQPRLLAAAAV